MAARIVARSSSIGALAGNSDRSGASTFTAEIDWTVSKVMESGVELFDWYVDAVARVSSGELTSCLAFFSMGGLVRSCGTDGACRRLRYETLSVVLSVVLGCLPKCSASRGPKVRAVASASAKAR